MSFTIRSLEADGGDHRFSRSCDFRVEARRASLRRGQGWSLEDACPPPGPGHLPREGTLTPALLQMARRPHAEGDAPPVSSHRPEKAREPVFHQSSARCCFQNRSWVNWLFAPSRQPGFWPGVGGRCLHGRVFSQSLCYDRTTSDLGNPLRGSWGPSPRTPWAVLRELLG